VGSRLNTNLAYIAGFLDGDGSLMLQLKKRNDGKSKLRFMCTICLYQDTRHEESLIWMQKLFKIGYISRRNDGISELRINGFKQVRDILSKLIPFIRFKKIQAKALFKAAELLADKSITKLSSSDLRLLVNLIIAIQNSNYITKTKRSKNELLTVLGLTP
jgi:hypothetical protein